MAPGISIPIEKDGKLEKKPISFINLAVGAGEYLFFCSVYRRSSSFKLEISI